MDALAVYKATQDAAERARRGEGPTLIEAVTYRYGPHSMSGDDPTKYRTKDEQGEWEDIDPIIRMRKYLEAKGLWSEEEEKQVMEDAKNTVNEQIKKAEQTPKMTIEGLIDSMFEETPQDLEEQKALFAAKGDK